MKKAIINARLLSVLLVIATVIAFIPFFGVETDAATVEGSKGVLFDFQDKTVGEAVTTSDSPSSDFIFSTATRLGYFADPTNADNVVIGKKSGDNAYLLIKDANNVLKNKNFYIEADFYVESMPVALSNSGNPLSLIAIREGETNNPLVRINGSDGALSIGDGGTGASHYVNSYGGVSNSKVVAAKMEIGNWYKVRVELDQVNHAVSYYLDGSYIGGMSLSTYSDQISIRILQPNGKSWQIYTDNINIGIVPEMSFDFNGGTAGEALVADDLALPYGFSVKSISNMAYAVDPTDETNVVITHNEGVSNGNFQIKDENELLLSSRFTIETDVYVESYPVAVEGSGDPLALVTWANNSGNIPLVRIGGDGVLRVTNKNNSSSTVKNESSYTNTGIKLELENWYNIKLEIDEIRRAMLVYLDGEPILYTLIPNFSTSSHLRFLQGNGAWSIYMDNISVKKYIYSGELNQYIDFEKFNVGDTYTTERNALAQFPNGFGSTDSVSIVADPDDANNKVAWNGTNNQFLIYMQDPVHKMAKSDFVVEGRFRFSEFPEQNGEYYTISLFAFVQNSATYSIFCGVDSNGQLRARLNGESYDDLGIYVNKDEWFKISVFCDSATGKFDLYLNGEFICVGDVGAPKTATTDLRTSMIRVMNAYQSGVKFGVYVDDLKFYELSKKDYVKSDVIWDFDFDSVAAGTAVTKSVWNQFAVAGEFESQNNPSYNHLSIAEYNGSNALKVAKGTNDHFTRLYMGNGAYDPFKDSTISIKFDVALSDELFEEGATPKLTKAHSFIKWRRFDTSKTGTAIEIIGVNTSRKLTFRGVSLDYVLDWNTMYSIEIILDSTFDTATIKVKGPDDEKPVTIIDSYSANSAIKDGSGKATKTIDYLNKSYIIDDGGVKRLVPYNGFIKSYRTDYDGNKITDAEGNYVLEDKLVSGLNIYRDMLQLFQGNSKATDVYYIDNFIIEDIGKQGNYISTDFTNWKKYDETDATKEGDKNVEPNTNYVFKRDQATYATEENGNVYLKLPSATNQTYFWIGDKHSALVGEDVMIETDILLTAEGNQGVKPLVSMLTSDAYMDNVTRHFDGAGYRFLLYADGNGNLYRSANNVTKAGDAIAGAKLKIGEWTKIGIGLTGNGKDWKELHIYVDGVLVSSQSISFGANVKGYSIRFTGVFEAVVGYDNLSVTEYKPKTNPLILGFEGETEITSAIAQLGAGWQYGIIGETRENADGETVKNTEILGADDKYLRVNHERLKDNDTTHIDAKLSSFIDADTYVIETAVRYSAKTAYGLNVAEFYKPLKGVSAPLLTVRGDSNAMFVYLRGVQYDIVNSEGKPIYAAKITDESFTNVSILVDSASETYTLYVNGRLAYYVYNGQAKPCVDMPMHFMSNTSDATENFVRLLEIPKFKEAEGTLDVGYINLRSMYNGLAAEIKGSQTRTLLSEDKFDVRFVSGIDTLCANSIGYEIVAEYTDENGSYVKDYDVFSQLVFERIDAGDGYVTAESQNSTYLAAIEVRGIPVDITVKFTATPYVVRGEDKVYGEAYAVTFTDGEIVK